MSKKRPLHSPSFHYTSKKLPAALLISIVLCYLTLLVLHRHSSEDHSKIPPFHSREEFLDLEIFSKDEEVSHHRIFIPGTSTNNATYFENVHEDTQFQGCPKIAFMFLARKALPLDLLWHAFFQTGAMSNFSIYVHSEPGFVLDNSTTSSPYFYGRQLNNSIKVSWGSINMIEAEKLLLNTALQDPSNQRFLLLSDSCVPLYNFSFVYKYIMSSQRSFVDSFIGPSKGQYSLNMLPTVHVSKWRKGSQWFVLTRKHARIVVSDSEVLEVFRNHCKLKRGNAYNLFNNDQNTFYGFTSFCVPDEHYIPTLLAIKEIENEVERRTLTYTSWGGTASVRTRSNKIRRPAHPDTFHFVDADPKHIREIRKIDNIYIESEHRTQLCHLNSAPTTCFLFARKFSKNAALRLLTSGMFTRNYSSLGTNGTALDSTGLSATRRTKK